MNKYELFLCINVLNIYLIVILLICKSCTFNMAVGSEKLFPFSYLTYSYNYKIYNI